MKAFRFHGTIPCYHYIAAIGLFPLFALLAACAPDEEREHGAETGLSGDSWEHVQQRGSGTIDILYVPSGGFAYEDDRGELTGATIEILRAFRDWVEDTHQVEIELRFTGEREWQRFYRRVAGSDGEGVIGTGNVTITEERREEVQFSPPYLDNIAVLVSHRDRPELESMEQIPELFAGHRGLYYPATLHSNRMEALRERYYPDLEMDTVRSDAEIMERISEGDYYFTYLDVHNFVNGLQEGVPLKRHEAGDDQDEQFGFIMPPGSDWAGPMEAFFEHDGGFLESETYRQIIREHLGEDMMRVLGQ